MKGPGWDLEYYKGLAMRPPRPIPEPSKPFPPPPSDLSPELRAWCERVDEICRRSDQRKPTRRPPATPPKPIFEENMGAGTTAGRDYVRCHECNQKAYGPYRTSVLSPEQLELADLRQRVARLERTWWQRVVDWLHGPTESGGPG